MKKNVRTNGQVVITLPVHPTWSTADYVHETEALRDLVWPAVQKLLAEEWPNFSAVFTSDGVDICTCCGDEFMALSADEAADWSTNQDEHSIEGEPSCCYPAIVEFRAERGIPALIRGNAR